MSRHVNRTVRTSRVIASVALSLAFLLSRSPANAQDTPREVRAKAQLALSQGAYADAVGFLQQLVDWYGESKKEVTVVSMENVYFSLGTCRFLLGEFGEARETFQTYQKKFRSGGHAPEVAVYVADCYRMEERMTEALKAYNLALKNNELNGDLRADVYMSMARCFLSQDKWDKAIPILRQLYSIAPDFQRRNWAASLLTTAYLKERQIEKVYRLVPYLLIKDSFASRSVAFNMAALEAGDDLFGDEKYRDALWLYRLIYPHDVLAARSQQYLEYLTKKAERLKKVVDNPRILMRVQESIGELEAEIKALESIENYDIELRFRMARSYMEIRRFREARDIFLVLHGEAKEPQANEALYLAFQCCVRVPPWDRAIEVGKQYMEKYPGGEYYDDVSILVAQIYAKQEDWPQVIATILKALEVSPKHSEMAECLFLLGYAYFMEEKFADSVSALQKLNREYPANPREMDAHYWAGMALMFDKRFEEAAPEFDTVLTRFPNSPFRMDSLFRRAVCDYGVSKYREAEKQFLVFVDAYPTNKLSGEAYMMLADIAGTFAELPKAVERYKQVPRYDVNIEFYNYAAFRCGEMLNEMGDFRGMIAHFENYIKENREGANVPLAMYWVASGLWSTGEQKGALDYFKDGVVKFGVDRKALGVDLLLEDWVGRTKKAPPAIAQAAWQDIADLLKKAQDEKQPSLALRLERILLYQPDITKERKDQLTVDLVRPENLPYASPGVLEFMLDQAQKQKDDDLGRLVAEQIIKDFTETDYALAARMYVARLAMAKEDYKTAVKHLTIVQEVNASTSDAAEALIMLGDLYLKMAKYDKADDCYNKVLKVREWRGPLWPAAVYGLGESQKARRSFEKAAAYYERVYLLYSAHRKWAAKAYLARADCLTRVQQYNKAAETLEAMVAVPELAEMPEIQEARQQLESLSKKRNL